MIISQLYQKEIIIIHDSGYETIINTNKNPVTKLYLGLMGESHYIPLKELNDNIKPLNQKYNEAKLAFHVWAIQTWKQLNESNNDLTNEKTNIDDFIPILDDDTNNEMFVSFN